MKLYLSSYRIPTPEDLEALLGKSFSDVSVALIPNAKDYYIKRAKDIKVGDVVEYMKQLNMKVDVVDLQDYDDPDVLKQKLAGYDMIWAAGGNTYMLRYEMRRGGFETIIKDLLDSGVVYAGESAGALVAGQSIAGVESADEPGFAEEVIEEGFNLVPSVILPHADNPWFSESSLVFKGTHQDKTITELKDSQAMVVDGDAHRITEAKTEV